VGPVVIVIIRVSRQSVKAVENQRMTEISNTSQKMYPRQQSCLVKNSSEHCPVLTGSANIARHAKIRLIEYVIIADVIRILEIFIRHVISNYPRKLMNQIDLSFPKKTIKPTKPIN
jgi:hypothetical protein